MNIVASSENAFSAKGWDDGAADKKDTVDDDATDDDADILEDVDKEGC